MPGVGDLVGGALSAYIILEAARLGVPRSLLARMGYNVLVDVTVTAAPGGGGGSVPSSAVIQSVGHSFQPSSVTISVGGTVTWNSTTGAVTHR